MTRARVTDDRLKAWRELARMMPSTVDDVLDALEAERARADEAEVHIERLIGELHQADALHERDFTAVVNTLEAERARADDAERELATAREMYTACREDRKVERERGERAVRTLWKSRSWWIHTKCQQVDQLLRGKWALEERIKRAGEALISHGYFKPEQVGDDIAPRIIELASALDCAVDQRDKALAQLAKVRELADSNWQMSTRIYGEELIRILDGDQ